MKLEANIGGKNYSIDLNGVSIAIPMKFNGPQPNTYGVPDAVSKAYEGGGFVGDIRRGGPCNFETYTLTPHCNGTHTEGIGHISKERIAIIDSLKDSLVPCTLISIEPDKAIAHLDSYQPDWKMNDFVITRFMLEDALKNIEGEFLRALVIRTIPNDNSKMSRDYMKEEPVFLSNEAMQYIVELGVTHLLVDFPSVDRLFDDGKLSNHHIFWGMEQGSSDAGSNNNSDKTITEFVFVPDQLIDGNYILNLQIAPFVADAAPSQPVLFPIQSKS